MTCPSCGAAVDSGDVICSSCLTNLTRPTAQAPEQADDPSSVAQPGNAQAICPHCGAVTAQVGSAVCSNCLLPLRAIDAMTDGARSAGATSATRREVGAETLRLRFRAGGEVDVRRGASLVLGRDPQVSPAAGTLAEFDNVSRRHAVISVDAGGAAWAEDTRSTNGTFVNGARVPPGTRARLRDRDELRLGSDVVAEVSLLPDEDRQ